ncbi:hypothetical protein [Flavobacterium ustbae]|uniref:hypothetical protein n=1 Tax=Flavobacterium ustbae TaxID=2488790 RepID=UPI000F784A5D|nr:hypothetical protein [Flavobacterium ustbae]
MKKIFLLGICFFGSFVYSQKADCNKFKTGKFVSQAFPNEYIIRKDSIEEAYMDGKLQSVWAVKWLSDCKFECVCIKNNGSEYVRLGDRFVSEIINSFDENCITLSNIYYNEEKPNGMEFQRGVCLQDN